MADVRFALMSYPTSSNLGDDIQSLAAEQFVPRVDHYFDRDALNKVQVGGPVVTMMNGWFLENPECWPPAPDLIPVLTGFHITTTNRSAELLLQGGGVSYLRAHEPIGCRDEATADLLRRNGIEAHYVGCPTTTFPSRGNAPQANVVFLVQTEGIRVPAALSRGALRTNQRVATWASPKTRRLLAIELLDLYRRRARLVVTTKLHCALPCAALGIPVILFGDPRDPRLSPAKEAIGVHEFKANRFAQSFAERARRRRENDRVAKEIDWDPSPVDMSAIKDRVRADIRARVSSAVETAEGTRG